ncbi:hypothetical protein ACOQFL_17060 [Actinopolyspora sp. H202]|uniref:Uncharacterized protein n=1 Tax=Actinopolyspora alba TaxID=673379 RepID=A0A1I2C5I1_9ACTN|nr:hypothetical protein [Actinopolyspora alba]SFE63544.1 hypothetical protein SAMN04487819_11934 [Actinopolyspora alba]
MNRIENAATQQVTASAGAIEPMDSVEGVSPVLTAAVAAGAVAATAAAFAAGNMVTDYVGAGYTAKHDGSELSGMSVGDLVNSRREAMSH